MVSPGPGPVLGVRLAQVVQEPLIVSAGVAVQVPPFVTVTPRMLYDPLVTPDAGEVLTSTVAPGQTAWSTVMVGGVEYVPPELTVTKLSRVADAVAVSERVSTGFAVTVMTAVAVRGVVL